MDIDIANLAPHIAKLIGVQPSTLVLLMFIIVKGAGALSRRIPSTTTGWLGTVRTICAIIGVNVENRVTPDTTVTDVAIAALKTPPIPQKVEAAQEENR